MNNEELSLGPMTINGHHINLTVYTTEELTENERQERLREIHQKMISALPTYQIDIDLDGI
jgi:hypothetical protein